jgi:hypothetical protein
VLLVLDGFGDLLFLGSSHAFLKVMARCSPLHEDGGKMAKVENIDEVVVAAELERVFVENPAASDGEKRAVGSDAEDTLIEGGSGAEKLRTYYFGSLTITIGKIKGMVEKGYFLEGEAVAPGAETMPEPNMTKLWYMRTFLSLAWACLLIRPWLTFCYTSKRNCIS